MADDRAKCGYTSSLSEWMAFVAVLPVPFYRTTVEGTIVFCNDAFARRLGYAECRPLLQRSILDFYEEKTDRGRLFREIMEQDVVVGFPLRLRTRDGSVFDGTTTARKICDDEKSAAFFEGFVLPTAGQGAQTGGSPDRGPDERFQGVLEMAGGVSHHLNHPLMIITNLLEAMIARTEPGDPNYEPLRKINDQIQKLVKLARKIGGIKKYESMDYVAGIRIVDIDRAS